MKKNRSTIIHDAIALFAISLGCILALSFVYEITKAPILSQEMNKKLEAYQVVYKDAVNLKEDTELMEQAATVNMGNIDSSFAAATIDEINQAYDGNDNLIGYIVKVSNKGYKGQITMVLGYSVKGEIRGLEIISTNDTAGLGDRVKEADFRNQFINKAVDRFVTSKSGATADNEINAITGATISTDGVVNGVNAAIAFLNEYSGNIGGGANE